LPVEDSGLDPSRLAPPLFLSLSQVFFQVVFLSRSVLILFASPSEIDTTAALLERQGEAYPMKQLQKLKRSDRSQQRRGGLL
jgi:hypothetical protein